MAKSFNLARLANRKLLKITGPDCYPYLQGLLCNDLRYLYEPDRIPKRRNAAISPSVIGTFMLNAQGRAICDMLLYRTPYTRYKCEFTPPGKATEPDELLIECHADLASGLANTLYGYRVRRKIALEIQNNSHVWCLYPRCDSETNMSPEHVENICSVKTLDVVSDHLTIVNDPRFYAMGYRILSKSNEFEEMKNILESSLDGVDIQKSDVKDYTLHRYKFGLGEGPDDHPEGNCLPLECNADFMGSVSFNKGCYLGQELTARIHFTGVIRKRLMPLLLDRPNDPSQRLAAPLIQGLDILDEPSGKKLGTLRSVFKNRALALLRHDLIDASTTKLIISANEIPATTWRPYWWGK